MMKKEIRIQNLYIIGNGFDLWHGIKSKYSDFREYVQKNNIKLYNMINEIVIDGLWGDIEEMLGEIDYEEILVNSLESPTSYGDEDWSDSDNHNYQLETERLFEFLIPDNMLDNSLLGWINNAYNIYMREEYKIRNYGNIKNSFFINFNYTPTLEDVYQISEDQILYIHGKATDKNLIFGHANPSSNNTRLKDVKRMERKLQKSELLFDYDTSNSLRDELSGLDPRDIEAANICEDIHKERKKDTESIIEKNNETFNNCSNVENIFILGHSLSNVDRPYFKKVYELAPLKAIWHINAYGEDKEKKQADFIKKQKFLNEIGVLTQKIKEVRIDIL